MNEDEEPLRVETLGGDGLHDRTVTWHRPEEGVLRLFESFGEGFFWRDLAEQRAECDEILCAAGFVADEYPGDRDVEPYSQVWYAGQVGWRCAWLLQARENGDPIQEMMLLRIMEIGALSVEWEWRLSYRTAILTGAKQLLYLTRNRESRNAKQRAAVEKRRKAVAALIKETTRTGGALDKWLMQQLKQRHGIEVCERTVRGDRKALQA